ncbi:hypothetical protein J2755_001283 [Methanohalophilus levihalophilus]|uniref:DUF1638 domain-containing protein n=1 Tax=Methanohalophilus levihalophilus TaxID=1431282 RepID=UPI001AE1E7D5|nr:DUF1638 domain-containing protein [Methanohalophilus levihalophilus]MBP2030349.1 hypothetical protein [Methanohalophilus levihalophilus]
MLEDELVYVLSKDLEIKNLFVVENKNSLRFVQKLKSENLKPFVFSSDRLYPIVLENNRRSSGRFIKLFSDIPILRQIYDSFNRKKQQELTVVVNLLRKDLHSDIDHLQSEVYLNAREISKISDGILLFYGKCGYSSKKVQDDLQGLDCPVYFLRDNERNLVDDCISVALGGNDAYGNSKELGKGKGVFYATPMWLSDMNKENFRSTQSYKEHARYLRNPDYAFLVKINNQIYKDNTYHENASEFAKEFDMEIINTNGTMDIASNSYMETKTSISESGNC